MSVDALIWDRENKNSVRKKALAVKGPKRRVLLMPGSQCLDIKEGFKTGVFDQKTEFHLIERDRKTADRIHKFCSKLKNPRRFHHHVGELNTFPVPSKVDFAFLDLCGNFTEDDLMWLVGDLLTGLTARSDLSITFTMNVRGGNKFIRDKITNFQVPELGSELSKYHRKFIAGYGALGTHAVNKVTCQFQIVYEALQDSGIRVIDVFDTVYRDDLPIGDGVGSYMFCFRLSLKKNRLHAALTLSE